MDRSQYTHLTPSSEGPNPLRPYYRPPSIGVQNPDSSVPNATVPPPHGAGAGRFSSAPASKPPSSRGIGSSARSYLSAIDYNEFLGETGAPTTTESVRTMFDSLVWRYSSVFMAQPFEVAKMVLQCYDATGKRAGSTDDGSLRGHTRDMRREHQGRSQRGKSNVDYEEDDDDDDEADGPSYFTSYDSSDQQVATRTKGQSSVDHRLDDHRSHPRASNKSSQPPWRLDLRKPDSLLEVLSQLWQREGSWGFWKGTNVTFIYGLLFRTLETWTRSMLSALLNLPDPGIPAASGGGVGGLDIIDSPSPFGSLSVVVAATGLTGLLLAPLDIVRTRLILTPTIDTPRSILPCLHALPSWLCPSSLLAPTALQSALPTLVSTSTPLFLRSMFRIDPIITPAAYSVCTFLSSSAELFLRLPIETVLRRAQINSVRNNESPRSTSRKPSRPSPQSPRNRRKHAPEAEDEQKLNTIVEVGPYTGVIASMWHIAREEGETVERKGPPGSQQRTVIRTRKGQGVHGLWRGWRVGWWGLVGVWGAAALGGAGGKGGEF